MFVAIRNAIKGLHMIDANVEVISKDLDAHPEVIMEGIQSLLRAEGNIKGYVRLRGTVAFSLIYLAGTMI